MAQPAQNKLSLLTALKIVYQNNPCGINFKSCKKSLSLTFLPFSNEEGGFNHQYYRTVNVNSYFIYAKYDKGFELDRWHK